jgi:hypothetical protein
VPSFDDRLTRELERAARPAAPDPVRTFEDVTRRRARRTVLRKVQVVAAVVAILVVTAGAFWFVDHRAELERPAGAPTPPPPGDDIVSMLQWRPVVEAFPRGAAEAPEPTCLPRECSLAQTEGPGHVVLVGTAVTGFTAGTVFVLEPAVADGTHVVAAESFGSLDGTAAVRVVLDPDAMETIVGIVDAGRREGVAIVWNGEVVGVMGGSVTYPIGFEAASVQEAEDLVDALRGGTPEASNPPTPTPTAPPVGAEGEDIGLPTRLCDVRELDGLDLLGDGTPTTAWTGNPVSAEGRCPRVLGAVVAVDVTGDGRADLRWGPIERCRHVGCAPLGAADLDADGDDELVIHTAFSIVDHLYFAVRPSGDGVFTLAPIEVAEPGNPVAAVLPGEPLVTSAAGDEGYAGWMRCEGFPETPVLVWAWTNHPIDSDRPAEWHRTELRLEADGLFHVIGSTDVDLPPGERPDWLLSSDPACGLDFDVWSAPNPG